MDSHVPFSTAMGEKNRKWTLYLHDSGALDNSEEEEDALADVHQGKLGSGKAHALESSSPSRAQGTRGEGGLSSLILYSLRIRSFTFTLLVVVVQLLSGV